MQTSESRRRDSANSRCQCRAECIIWSIDYRIKSRVALHLFWLKSMWQIGLSIFIGKEDNVQQEYHCFCNNLLDLDPFENLLLTFPQLLNATYDQQFPSCEWEDTCLIMIYVWVHTWCRIHTTMPANSTMPIYLSIQLASSGASTSTTGALSILCRDSNLTASAKVASDLISITADKNNNHCNNQILLIPEEK